jgi:hypothetical protein
LILDIHPNVQVVLFDKSFTCKETFVIDIYLTLLCAYDVSSIYDDESNILDNVKPQTEEEIDDRVI